MPHRSASAATRAATTTVLLGLFALLAAPALVSAAPPAPVPHGRVLLHDDALWIDGHEVYLYGGEVQYFRIRAADANAAATHALWAETLDKMVAAGMNFVSTYVPWDYHEPAFGAWDFAGAKDLDAFLDLCYKRHLYVLIKPGPYITAEWPKGFGTFGAVPRWFTEAHPETLVAKPDGSPWSFDFFGAPSGRQCSYLHPTFLYYTRRWFTKIAPILKKYIYTQPCIVMVQLDNETCLFWEDHYKVDYSPTALAFYRQFLKLKYGSIAALNALYHTSYAAFAEVGPPTAPPIFVEAERYHNPWHADWFEAGAAYAQKYLSILRHEWEVRGIAEPRVKFTLNDGPQDVPTRNIVMYNGPRKNAVALDTLDVYPKYWPTNNDLMDTPFLADYAVKLYDRHNDANTGPQRFAMGTEIQGGWYSYPYGITPNVRPEETGQLLTKFVGHGLKAGSIYVFRGGYNADNSTYPFAAALDLAGHETPRYEVLKTIGTKLLKPFAHEVLQGVEVENQLAIVVNQKYAAPQGGVLDNLESLTANEYAGLFGWCITSGYNPAVLDLATATAADLAAYRAVLYLNPDYLSEADAAKLAAYTAGGGTLVNFLWPGRNNLKWEAGAPGVTAYTGAMFPATGAGQQSWWLSFGTWTFGPGLVARIGGEVNASFPGYTGTLTSQWYVSHWDAPPAVTPFLWQRLPGGASGHVVGYRNTYGAGKAFFLGTYLASEYNRNTYYGLAPAELAAKTKLLEWLMAEAGVERIVDAANVRGEAWARRVKGTDEVFLYVVNSGPAQTMHLAFGDTAALGLLPGKTYTLTRLLAGVPLPGRTPASLAADGLDFPLPEYGYEVVRLK